MSSFVENPELVRHLRMELRPRRMAMAAVVSISVSLMVWFISTKSENRPANVSDYQHLYTVLASVQAVLLVLWCFAITAQSIANERVMRTFDFLRTTRLNAGELLTGMVLGIPSMAYFVVTISYGITILAGLLGGFELTALLTTYAFTVMLAMVVSLAGLSLSMLLEKPRFGGLLGFLLLYPLSALIYGASETAFPAMQSVAIVPGLLPLFGVIRPEMNGHVKFFGMLMPTLVVSAMLYASFAAWMVLALVRNLKREREDIQLLSRWQAIGFVVYVNVLTFGLADFSKLMDPDGGTRLSPATLAEAVTTGFLILNLFVMYMVGLTTLSTPERLKIWWRDERQDLATYFADDGPPWTWMVIAAACAMVLFVVLTATITDVSPSHWKWPLGPMAVLLAFSLRDVTFLQWCTLTKMKEAVGKGLAFLLLYYFAVFTFLSVFRSDSMSWKRGAAVLTPLGAFFMDVQGYAFFGVVLQLVLAVLIGVMMKVRFERSSDSAQRSSAV